MRLKVIACDVLKREISYLAALSEQYVDVTFLRQGLHDEPERLKRELQEQIRLAEEGFPYNHYGLRPSYDYIVLGYGLCSNSVLEMEHERLPLVMPRAHDCVTLMLGSKEEYDRLFSESGGTYWYSRGWIECNLQPGEERFAEILREYSEKYGEENAEYLMGMEQGWFEKYDRAVFVDWPCLNDGESYRNFTKECADYLKWKYEEYAGDVGLMRRMLNGIFDEREVLVAPPGKKIVASHDDAIVKVE
jgi:hypothetical protein